jgi:predicted phage-related endonuclease
MQRILKPTHGSIGWHAIRHRNLEGKCVLGASEVSVVMGANQYENKVDLAIRKLGTPQVSEPNEAMIRGNVLEPALLQHAINEVDASFYLPDEMYLNGRIIATLDGRSRINEALLLEAKTNNRFAIGDPLPMGWVWQAQAQMFCTDAQQVVFVILDKHLRIGFHTVDRDTSMIHDMRNAVELFCEYIDNGCIPDNEPLTVPQVNTLYPDPAGETDLGSSAIAIINEWGAIKTAIHELEEQEKACKDALANLMRDADFGLVDGQRVLSFKSQQSKRFDYKALIADHPDLEAKYTTTTSFRVMRTVR